MTMARLVVSPAARHDLDEILAYLARVAGTSLALRYGSRFRAAFRHLIDFPETGARRARFGPEMRIWAIAPYVIFYRFSPAEQTIYLARIVHGRRNVTPRLLEP